MPKQLYKINQFHGGLSSNSDARDIAENELSDATDVMVDELGKIRMMGGVSTSGMPAANTAAINAGYGLFQFSHDRLEGETAGAAAAETGDDYLAMADTNANANIDIYSSLETTWGTGKIDLGDTTGMKPTFYAADGALRVSDGNFGSNNETQWYGYVNRWFFGDGTSGYDEDSYSDNGLLRSLWVTGSVSPTALTLVGISSGEHNEVIDTTNGSPISIHFSMEPNYNFEDLTGGGSATTDTYSIELEVDILASGDTITASDNGGGSLTPGFAKFCSVGDRIIIFQSAEGANNEVVHTVTAVTADTTSPNVITVGGSLTDATNDEVQIHNLSRSEWFDVNKPGWNVAVSTLYDDSKQESELSISSTTLEADDFFRDYSGGNTGYGMGQFSIMALVFAGNGSSTGLPFAHPRVSGFNVYMRRTDGSSPDPWYLQATIDVTRGAKAIGVGEHNMWYDAEWTEDDNSAYCKTGALTRPTNIITYEDNTGFDSSQTSVGFNGVGTGFKTAVIANRIAYVGNVKIKDRLGNATVYGDAVLKSRVNKFDSFSLDRRIEASVNDGDSIVKLEAYADRLLIFKKKKLELVNISQEVEFLEDTFLHKGVSHPAATCKTDFGIAWVNSQGCYLYDGQKVNNLLEKGGRQIIKESEWATFTTREPMIGYIPKKRQLLVVDDNTSSGDGKIFLYDMVTQSWVKGADLTITSQALTNFVTDWNDDLIWAHTTGTPNKWDDDGDDSTAFVVQTKDIDFGQPAQKKKIYKVYVTYTGVSSLDVDVEYRTNGDGSWTAVQSGETLDQTSGQNEATLTLATPVECYSFQLKFSGTGKTAFEINDASIVFRLKGQR